MTINQEGYYKIELTALMSLNKYQHRVEVFKKVSGTTCDRNSVILALNARNPVNIYALNKSINIKLSYNSRVTTIARRVTPMLRVSSS